MSVGVVGLCPGSPSGAPPSLCWLLFVFAFSGLGGRRSGGPTMASTDILVWAGGDICKTHRYAEPRPWSTRAAYSWMGIIDNTHELGCLCIKIREIRI